jgi:hypothetical protein
MAKVQKMMVTPKWVKIKEMYENGTNGSDKYGTNFPINGELDKLTLEFVEIIGKLTRRFGFDCVIEDVKMDLWKERIWSLIENAGLLQDIAWKVEKYQDEIEDNFDDYDTEDWGDEDIEPTDEELMNLECENL